MPGWKIAQTERGRLMQLNKLHTAPDMHTAPDAARLAAAAVVIQAFYRGQVDRRLASSLAAYVLFFSVSTRLSPWP